MSNPISTLPNSEQADGPRPADQGTDTEVEDVRIESALEVDAQDENTATASADASTGSEESKSPARTGLVILILAGLLLGSIAINLKQSRDVAGLESRSTEYQQALAAAVERIDSETSRADGAEAALGRVDSAVDLVNERVVGLQEALNGLREATLR